MTLGVPRLNELLNVSRNIRTPSIIINPRVPDDKNIADDLISSMEYTVLGDITLRTEIHYDPDPRSTVVPEDVEFVEEYYQVDTDEVSPESLSP